MFPGPIFRRELKAAASRRDLFIVRVVLALLLGGIAALAGLGLFDREARDRGLYKAAELQKYAEIVFATMIGVEIMVLSLLTPTAVSPSIAQEREKDTLPLLLLTRLTRVELVATKLTGRLMPSLLLLLTGLPLVLGGAWYSAVPALVVVEILAVSASSLAVGGSLAILSSARSDRSDAARRDALFWTLTWLVGIPLIALLPVRSGTLWSDLLVELRRLSSWIAPSSPMSLLTDSSWSSGAGAGTISQRLVTMLALQAIVIVLALSGAVASLRLREPRSNRWDPHRGYRPPVGDDPIFWREYVLPWRGSRLPLVVVLSRQILILLKAILLLGLQLVFVAFAVAVLIGLVIGAAWYAFFAFRELWDYRSFAAGPYQARDRLNLFIRGVTGLLGLLPLLGVPSGTAGRITIERDKKTWEPLLTTPLTGAEILWAKSQVTVKSLWEAGRWLIPLWLLGIASGALHPVGALAAAVELPLAAWVGLAVGTRLGIRTGSTTQAASSASALWSIGLLPLGGLLVVFPLCSGREFAEFGTWDIRLRWLVVVLLPAAALLMAAFAWWLMRRCFERFDEWVGRPYRPVVTGTEGGKLDFKSPGSRGPG